MLNFHKLFFFYKKTAILQICKIAAFRVLNYIVRKSSPYVYNVSIPPSALLQRRYYFIMLALNPAHKESTKVGIKIIIYSTKATNDNLASSL